MRRARKTPLSGNASLSEWCFPLSECHCPPPPLGPAHGDGNGLRCPEVENVDRFDAEHPSVVSVRPVPWPKPRRKCRGSSQISCRSGGFLPDTNYDIPWNPARLEQRMGRIHRYGQKHDVRVVNLVAGGTREGRVLKVLLDKLESVRRALSSDKVFDVIGSLLENTSLREFMIDALTDEGEQRVLQRIERAVTGTAVGGIVERQAKVYGAAGEIAPRLSGMRQELDRERYLHLLPAYVRLFVESAAAKLGIGIQGDPDGVFSLEPVTRGSLDALLPALEGYLSAVRDRLRIRRPGAGEACIWLHPGEPVFDALCSRVVDALAHHARRGAIFIHPRADEAGLWHLAALSVEDDSSGVALAGEFPNPTRRLPGLFSRRVCLHCGREPTSRWRRSRSMRCSRCTAPRASLPGPCLLRVAARCCGPMRPSMWSAMRSSSRVPKGLLSISGRGV